MIDKHYMLYIISICICCYARFSTLQVTFVCSNDTASLFIKKSGDCAHTVNYSGAVTLASTVFVGTSLMRMCDTLLSVCNMLFLCRSLLSVISISGVARGERWLRSAPDGTSWGWGRQNSTFIKNGILHVKFS